MKFLVSGASGLIGTALCAALEADGHQVLRLSRQEAKRKTDKRLINWNPEDGRLDIAELEKLNGVEAVVHLAGESIIGRWTQSKKRSISESRVEGTRLLSEALAQLPKPPNVAVFASAVGYYGHLGSEVLREDSASGKGFLAGVCREWENAAHPAREAGIRTVNARLGVVLSGDGGALQKMKLPFQLGLGGPIGSGRQYISWIEIDDAVRALRFAIEEESISGALNVVAPNPVPNRTFAQTLGRVLRRPAIVPLPAFAVRLAMGKEAANETLLVSQRAVPEKLLAHGFTFQHTDLQSAMRAALASAENTEASA
jgi:uncharacterized protein (TIGR01777 family)